MSTPTKALALRVIELACRAPSVHNTQPWRWRVADGATVDLYADRRRQLPVSDPSGRNLAISCGAALHHGSVVAQALGLTPGIELMPSADDQNHLARISLSPGARTDEASERLRALEERNTDRRRFTSWPVPDTRLAHLAKSASGWGAHAIPITDMTGRFRAEELLNRALELQASDPRFAEEQRVWTGSSHVDGVPVANAAPPAQGRAATRPNRFAPATKPGTDTRPEPKASTRVVESTDGLVAICTATDDQLSWLEAGEALSALWLRATHDGLAIVPLSQAIEVDETRQELRETVFDGMACPQILARVGWLETTRAPLARTPRRPLDDVLER